jgi:hypothetical protein
MKSQKITLTIAERIIDRVCDRDDNLWDWMAAGIEVQTFAYKMWLKRYAKHLEIMKQLPTSWQDRLALSWINFATAEDSRRYENVHMYGCAFTVYGSGNILLTDEEMDELQARIEKAAELCRAQRANRHKISCAIEQYNTTKQLIEGWPDVEQIVLEVLHELYGSPSRVPVVQNLNELNQIFKLPPKENNVSA